MLVEVLFAVVALFLGVAAAVFFLFDVVEVAGFLVVVAVVFLVEEALLAAGFFAVDGLLAVALGLEAVACGSTRFGHVEREDGSVVVDKGLYLEIVLCIAAVLQVL